MTITAHLGTPPGTVVDAIITALSTFLMVNGGAGVGGGSGCVRTVARYPGEPGSSELDLATIDRLCANGLPAMLVAYLGGPFGEQATTRLRFTHEMRFGVICCAASYQSRGLRVVGTTPTVQPGVWDLLDWATYTAVRAVANIGRTGGANTAATVTLVKPTAHRWLRLMPEHYVAVAELVGSRLMDTEDDAPAATLQTLGLVHDPIDPLYLFGAQVKCAAVEPFALTNGMTLTVKVNRGAVQTVTLAAADFASIGAATAAELSAVLADDLTAAGAGATEEGPSVALAAASYIEVTGGTANAVLLFPTAEQAADNLVPAQLDPVGGGVSALEEFEE
jgi:uncharacterized SAM-binding protein YcdF (DUF218 family)